MYDSGGGIFASQDTSLLARVFAYSGYEYDGYYKSVPEHYL